MAQVVERYFREVEAASSSLVTPIEKNLIITGFGGYQVFLFKGNLSFCTIFYQLLSFKLGYKLGYNGVQIGVQAECESDESH